MTFDRVRTTTIPPGFGAGHRDRTKREEWRAAGKRLPRLVDEQVMQIKVTDAEDRPALEPIAPLDAPISAQPLLPLEIGDVLREWPGFVRRRVGAI